MAKGEQWDVRAKEPFSNGVEHKRSWALFGVFQAQKALGPDRVGGHTHHHRLRLQAPKRKGRDGPHAAKDRPNAILRPPQAPVNEDNWDLGEPKPQAMRDELQLD